MTETQTDGEQERRTGQRRRWLIIVGVVVAVGLIAYGIYWFVFARNFETTDDAYIGGDVVAITAREPASVVAIYADNTETVRRGQLLVEFDPVRAKAALDAAEADLARTVRAVRTNFSKVGQFQAQLAAARTAMAQAQGDYQRRLSAGQAVSREELQHARDELATAAANVRAAESGVHQAQAAVQGTAIATNPDVLAAMAQVRQAAITLSHLKLYAPVDGVIAQRTVQVGQQVTVGAPLMAVVPLNAVWVDANFKEGQLADMRINQPVTVTADIYGSGVTYHGHILGFGAGSGSAFALLPPQNASGNWIKIVQRVPVRIALNRHDLQGHPLRVGLSASVSVDVADTSGPAIGVAGRGREVRGYLGDYDPAAVETTIRRIVAANGA